MIIVSLNSRGLGGAQRKKSLKQLFNNLKPTVIMIQETILEGLKAKTIFKDTLKDWEVESLDAVGLSGGLITAWSLAFLKTDSKKMESTLETKLLDKDTGITFTLINIYSPFYERKAFWEKIKT